MSNDTHAKRLIRRVASTGPRLSHRSAGGSSLVLALMWVLTLAGTAAAAPSANLHTFKSRFYKVHTNLSRRQVKPIAHRMDVIFHHYRKRFENFDRRNRSEISLYLFRTREQYVRFMGRHGVDASGSGGMFFVIPGRARGLGTWVADRQEKRITEVLQHEGFHQFAYYFIGRNLPQWVNEGLAQYFEDAKIKGRRIALGQLNRQRIRVLEKAYRQEALMPLPKILGLSGDEWNAVLNSSRESSTRMYAQAWSMVYFLIHAEGGKYQEPFRRYLHLLAKGRTHKQAAKTAFEVNTFRPMGRRWVAFLKNRLFQQ